MTGGPRQEVASGKGGLTWPLSCKRGPTVSCIWPCVRTSAQWDWWVYNYSIINGGSSKAHIDIMSL